MDSNVARQKWKEEDPQKYREHVRRANIRAKFGISTEEYEERLLTQEGHCAICGTDQPGKRGLFLDHNHETGKIREFLCHPCNAALGFVKENPSILQRMIAYLQKHE